MYAWHQYVFDKSLPYTTWHQSAWHLSDTSLAVTSLYDTSLSDTSIPDNSLPDHGSEKMICGEGEYPKSKSF